MISGLITARAILLVALFIGTPALRIRPSTRPPAAASCQDKKGRAYEIGATVESSSPCEKCTCGPNGSVLCATVDCMPCRGHVVPIDGQCCGDCYVDDVLILPGSGCWKNDTVFGFGDQLPTDNPCESCFCDEMSGVMCAVMACVPCTPPMHHVPVAGSCCGECRDVSVQPVLGCEVNGSHYNVGDTMPRDNPCETCHCGEKGGPVCISMACHLCPLHMQHVLVAGSCCGECRDVSIQPVQGCEVNGNHYDVGPFTDSDDVCKDCLCNDDGTTRCRKQKCPRTKCKKSLIAHLEDQCCPVCQCEHNGRLFMPGPVEDVCKSLVCENGKVTLSRPSQCPRIWLMCVDPKLGEDCCPYCPRGTTCQVGRTIITAGEYKTIGKKICTCNTDPWYPNAFCAQKKVNFSLKKDYGQYLADYRIPGL